MIRYTRDNGVSPVIAVLLILAMTVAAAGIVAVVTTGMTGDLQNGKQVGLIVKPAASGSDLLVTLIAGKDIQSLTKLEILDGNSLDGVFQEVTTLDGYVVSSFTTETYLGKNVASPITLEDTYTTTIVIRGTFSDSTKIILSQTKVTFRNANPSAPIKEYIKNFYLKSNDSEINISLSDLFYNGRPLSLSLAELATTNHNHKLIIDIPPDMIQEEVIAKIVITKYTIDNKVIETPNNNYNTGMYGNPKQDVTTVDNNNVSYITVSINLYDRIEFGNVWKNLSDKSEPWKNEELKKILKATQTGTITIIHDT